MAWKDYYSAILSSAALTISATSAYYSLFRVNLDAKLLVAGDDYPSYGENAGSIINVYWDVSLTFINNGNRPYSVRSLELETFSVKTLDQHLQDCKPLTSGGGLILAGFVIRPDATSFAPSVVDPGKIVILHPSYVDDPGKNPQPFALSMVARGASPRPGIKTKAAEPDPVSLIKAQLPGGVVNLVSCLRIELVDHEGHLHLVSKPVAWTRRTTVGLMEGDGETGQSDFIDNPIDLSRALSKSESSRVTTSLSANTRKNPNA